MYIYPGTPTRHRLMQFLDQFEDSQIVQEAQKHLPRPSYSPASLKSSITFLAQVIFRPLRHMKKLNCWFTFEKPIKFEVQKTDVLSLKKSHNSLVSILTQDSKALDLFSDSTWPHSFIQPCVMDYTLTQPLGIRKSLDQTFIATGRGIALSDQPMAIQKQTEVKPNLYLMKKVVLSLFYIG